MQNNKAIVQAVLAEFVSTIVPNEDEEAAKAQVCRLAAARIFAIDQDTGLLKKDSGNNINGRSVDVVISRRDGSGADCVSSQVVDTNQRRIIAVWVGYAPAATSDQAWRERWIEPTAAVAAEPGPLQVKQPAPGPDPPKLPNPTGKPDRYPDNAPWPMPPLPTRWADEGVEDYGYQWYAQMSARVEAIYLNLLWRWSDFQGAANWLKNIREDKMQPPAMIAAIKESSEYALLHTPR